MILLSVYIVVLECCSKEIAYSHAIAAYCTLLSHDTPSTHTTKTTDVSNISKRYKWRIYIVKFWTPLYRSNFLNFHPIFGKVWPSNRLPPLRVGAPPSGKSWIRCWIHLVLSSRCIYPNTGAKMKNPFQVALNFTLEIHHCFAFDSRL